MSKETGDRRAEASAYGNLGILFQSVGQYTKAEEYLQKALTMSKETGDRRGEASAYGNLGSVFQSFGRNTEAEDYYQKGLRISIDIGDTEKQFLYSFDLAWQKFLKGNMQEAVSYLHRSIDNLENIRSHLGDNDQLKISFLHERDFSYWMLAVLLYAAGSFYEALYVLELGRSRALSDLLSALYAVKIPIVASPKSWNGIENIMKKERNCTCLYFSSSPRHLFSWVLKTSGDICFRKTDVDECDWSVSATSSGFFPELPSPDSLTVFRIIEVEEQEENKEQLPPSLSQCYKILIAPVIDLLQYAEIIIVPDKAMYGIPFAALKNEHGGYLAENYRIRIIPSLMTLKLIQDSPEDYHSQTDALIVGDPDIGDVYFKGQFIYLSSLTGARKEAQTIGRLLGIKPLVGRDATKQAVVERMDSVSLIHFATHCHDSSSLALAPQPSTRSLPHEEDYSLTMSEISKVRLRAKLVVLSCCHSGGGTVGPEGVNGIARAFLGSGARSVLVAQWSLEDEATAELFSRFYEHLIHGESASESLHQAMKWMRENGFSDVRQWAPFMLIGDNVTFNFDVKVSQIIF